MKHLATITEQDIDPRSPVSDSSEFQQREAVRAIVVDQLGRLALLNVKRKGYHKLPGGGIDPDEDRSQALKRELMEEIGCTAEVLAEVGQITEYRDRWRQVQISYCYLAKQIGEQRPAELTQEEQDDGFEPIWVEDIDAVIDLLEADNPLNYGGLRIKPRDILFLRAAKPLIAQGL